MGVRRHLALAALALVAAGCSSGGSDAAAPVAEAPAASSELKPAPPTPTVGVPATQNVDDPYCQALSGLGTVDAAQASQLDDPAAVQASIETAEQGFAALRAAAPESIAPQWAQLGDAYGRLFTAYRTAGFDSSKLMADPTVALLFEELSSASSMTAANQIESFTIGLCGVPVGIGDAGDGDVSPTASEAPVVSSDDASMMGAQLLARFGIQATAEQQTCLGQAITDPAAVAEAAGSGDPADDAANDSAATFELYRRLASGCGIDVSLIPGG